MKRYHLLLMLLAVLSISIAEGYSSSSEQHDTLSEDDPEDAANVEQNMEMDSDSISVALPDTTEHVDPVPSPTPVVPEPTASPVDRLKQETEEFRRAIYHPEAQGSSLSPEKVVENALRELKKRLKPKQPSVRASSTTATTNDVGTLAHHVVGILRNTVQKTDNVNIEELLRRLIREAAETSLSNPEAIKPMASSDIQTNLIDVLKSIYGEKGDKGTDNLHSALMNIRKSIENVKSDMLKSSNDTPRLEQKVDYHLQRLSSKIANLNNAIRVKAVPTKAPEEVPESKHIQKLAEAIDKLSAQQKVAPTAQPPVIVHLVQPQPVTPVVTATHPNTVQEAANKVAKELRQAFGLANDEEEDGDNEGMEKSKKKETKKKSTKTVTELDDFVVKHMETLKKFPSVAKILNVKLNDEALNRIHHNNIMARIKILEEKVRTQQHKTPSDLMHDINHLAHLIQEKEKLDAKSQPKKKPQTPKVLSRQQIEAAMLQMERKLGFTVPESWNDVPIPNSSKNGPRTFYPKFEELIGDSRTTLPVNLARPWNHVLGNPGTVPVDQLDNHLSSYTEALQHVLSHYDGTAHIPKIVNGEKVTKKIAELAKDFNLEEQLKGLEHHVTTSALNEHLSKLRLELREHQPVPESLRHHYHVLSHAEKWEKRNELKGLLKERICKLSLIRDYEKQVTELGNEILEKEKGCVLGTCTDGENSDLLLRLQHLQDIQHKLEQEKISCNEIPQIRAEISKSEKSEKNGAESTIAEKIAELEKEIRS